MTCEFRFGAPSWGTWDREFKSRRSDQEFPNKSNPLRCYTAFALRRNSENKRGILVPKTAQTSSETSSVSDPVERKGDSRRVADGGTSPLPPGQKAHFATAITRRVHGELPQARGRPRK